MRFSPADSPIGGEQEQAVALHVLDGLGVAGEVEVTQDVGVGVVLDPAQLLEGELLHPDLDVVLGVQTVLQHFQLQHTDHANHDLLHAAADFAEDLDGTLLGDLLHTLHELLAPEYNVEIRMQQLPFEQLRWVKNDPDTYNLRDLDLTSDTKAVEDMKGNRLLLFTSDWAVRWAETHNDTLELSEFGNI